MLFSLCCEMFFFKQKTAYELRISDGSSDVCSSDLLAVDLEVAALRRASGSETLGGDGPAVDSKAVTRPGHHEAASRLHADARSLDEISGRAVGRQRRAQRSPCAGIALHPHQIGRAHV